MNAPQITYCNHLFVDEVINNRKKSTPHSIAYSIIDKLSDIVIDLSKDQLLELFKNNPIYNQLNKRSNRKIIPRINWKDSCDMTNVGDEMFFITPGYIDKHKELRSHLGCLVVSSDADIHILDRMNRIRPYSLIPTKIRDVIQEEVEDINSWAEVVRPIPLRPINAAIIIDNFLFNDKFEKRKEHSLYSILHAIIPNDLEIPFHLTIFANNDNGALSEEYLKNVKSEIEHLHICKELKVSIIAHTNKSTTHDREIVTNYHYFYSGAGFSVIDDKGVQQLAKGEIRSSFHSIDTTYGIETHKHNHKRCIAWAKEIANKQDNKCCFVVGDIENRLFR